MLIGKKIFPYPIINSNLQFTTYENATFNLVLTEVDSNANYVLKDIHFETNSKLLNDLIDKKLAEVVLIIESSKSIYRKKFNLNSSEGTDIVLKKSDFNGKVFFSMFAYVTDDIKIESSKEFIDDYQGIDFELEKYSIIAGNDGRCLIIEHEEQEDNLVKSIFTIIPSEEIEESIFKVEYNVGRKINILLSEQDFNKYQEMYNIPLYKELFFSVLLIPSLTEALNKCQLIVDAAECSDIDEIEHHNMPWFKSIIDAYEKIEGTRLTLDTFKDLSPILMAQKLFGKPITNTLTTILKSSRNESSEDYE